MVRVLERSRQWLEQSVSSPSDDASLKRQKTTLVTIAVLCSLTGIIAGTFNWLISEPLSTVVLPYAFAGVVGLAIVTYAFTQRFSLLLYSFLVMILATPVVFQCAVGGFTGDPGTVSIVFWALLAPVGALMFGDSRKAWPWFVAYIVLVVVAMLLDPFFKDLVFPSTYGKFLVAQGQNIIALSITLFLSMLYFVRAFQREHSRAEHLVVELTATNDNLEGTLRRLKETQLELVESEKLASLGKLAAGIAHEINNPLGALRGSVDSANRCIAKLTQFLEESRDYAGLLEETRFKKYLQILAENNQIASAAGDRVAGTVGNFIDFARLDGAEFDRVSVNECVDNTLAVIGHEIAGSTTIVRDYSDIPPLPCYPAEINQMLLNLLTHRLRALAGSGTVTIRTLAKGNALHLQITDDGEGMPPGDRATLFDPDFLSDKASVRASLGLFSCYNIVQKHGGKIEVESEIGKGTTFIIALPLDLEGPSSFRGGHFNSVK